MTHDPHLENLIRSRIGDTNLTADDHGDALGVAILPGDRWRRSHDLLKAHIYVDGRVLELHVQKEVYGLFTRNHSPEGQQAYGNLSRRQRSQQHIVPDLTSSNHIGGSVLQITGLQIHELKRIQSIQDQMTSTAYADGALTSELRTANSTRYLQNTARQDTCRSQCGRCSIRGRRNRAYSQRTKCHARGKSHCFWYAWRTRQLRERSQSCLCS